MLLHGQHLNLPRCPHCGIDSPSLNHVTSFQTTSSDSTKKRLWVNYVCGRCGGSILAGSPLNSAEIVEMYPAPAQIQDDVPGRAKEYLQQALDSLNAPAGSVVLSASAVDAMLKAKGLKDGSLYKRIDQAATEHLITKDMAQWAHDVRLDANEQRHSDDDAPLPTLDDAKRCIEFVQALAMFLFVLPARVKRGLTDAKSA